jgi:hypothetical protein
MAAVVAAAALTAAVPALADKPPHPTHPTHPTTPSNSSGGKTHPSQSHKCTAHKVAYIASGTLVTWSATANADGTYSGTIVVNVTRVNHHAAASTGSQTFTLSSTKVRFGDGVATPPAAGARVKVIGKITTIAKKCTDQTGAGTVTIKSVNVKAAQ